mmetsp:Transcript_6941/g.20278  ORF Transcript_6941/g.20278 Transcript_6941/m.20278 type:complete len:380 (-) Transcript_6941:808-1947(-)
MRANQNFPYSGLVHARNGRHRLALRLVKGEVMHRAVVHRGLAAVLVVVRERVLHPVLVVAVREVLVRVRAAALLARLGRVHRRGGIGQQVAQLPGLDEVRVPHERVVRDLDVLELLDDLIHLNDALLEHVGRAVDGGVLLHGHLHVQADVRRGDGAVGEAHLVQVVDGLLAGLGRQRRHGLARLGDVGDAVGAGAAEDDDVEEGVGAEAVRAVHRGGGDLARGEEARHDGVRLVLRRLKHLAEVVRGHAAHVVVHRGQHRDGLLGHVNAGEDRSRLADAWQALGEEVRRQVVEVQVDVVRLRPDAAALANLHGHGAADDVARGEVLGARRVALHEALAFAVAQDAALAAAALRHQAARAVDARWVELHELRVLVRDARA